MWKLKLSQGDEAWVTSVNRHIGRQYWEFDPSPGAFEEELAQVEEAQNRFRMNRFQAKHSSDLVMRLQVQSRRSFRTLKKVNDNCNMFMDCFFGYTNHPQYHRE